MSDIHSIPNQVRNSLTPRQASNISGLHPDYLARLANAGKLTVSKPGGTHRRYVRAEVEALAAPVQPREGER